MIIAIVGYTKANAVKSQSDVLATLDVPLLTIIVVAAGLATIVPSVFGFAGAVKESHLLLKFVRETYKENARQEEKRKTGEEEEQEN